LRSSRHFEDGRKLEETAVLLHRRIRALNGKCMLKDLASVKKKHNISDELDEKGR